MQNRRSLDPELAHALRRQPSAAGRVRLRCGGRHDLLARLRDRACRPGQPGAVRLREPRGPSRIRWPCWKASSGSRAGWWCSRMPATSKHITAVPTPLLAARTIIVEVAAPKGGAFHPKLWALASCREAEGRPVRLRLLVLSRNLTRDRSWDLALTLDGIVGKRTTAANKPLVELLHRLPGPGDRGAARGATRAG